MFARPRELLGEAVHARFGTEFPIRFDLLDTVGGGNLSLQVHPSLSTPSTTLACLTPRTKATTCWMPSRTLRWLPGLEGKC
ncbi:MAG: hypothetical protein WKG07_31915 [Hymenobacter sp.]